MLHHHQQQQHPQHHQQEPLQQHWSPDQILYLIATYRSHECLWKVHSEHYGDRDRKTQAWEHIARTVQSDVRNVEKKIKTLRTQFMNYYKLALKKVSDAGGDVEFQRPKWFAYNALEFLLEARLPRGASRESLDEDKVRLDREDLLENGRHEDARMPVKWETQEANDMECASLAQEHLETSGGFPDDDSSDAYKTFRKPDNFRSPQIVDPLTSLETGFHSQRKALFSGAYNRDEFAIFGEHIACRLRNISDSRTRLLVQHQIHNILFEAEMAKHGFHIDTLQSARSSYSGVPQGTSVGRNQDQISAVTVCSTSYSKPPTPEHSNAQNHNGFVS